MAEDAKNPVCGDKETNMNPEREFVFEEPEKLGINISSNRQSVFVSNVEAGSLAERKGLRVGDEIIFVEPHVEDDPHPIESIEMTRNQYNRFLDASKRPRSVSSPLVFKVRTPVSKKSSVQTKVVSTSGVGVCSSSRLKEQVANVAEDANMNPQDANMNPVCGEEKTNMNPERGNTASCASPEALPKFEAAANVADLPHPNDASEHDAQSTQPKDTIDETQRNGRVPKHGSAKHGELLHHISHFLFTLKFTLSSPQLSFRNLERIQGRTSTCLA